jgi:hypothetical protein
MIFPHIFHHCLEIEGFNQKNAISYKLVDYLGKAEDVEVEAELADSNVSQSGIADDAALEEGKEAG